MRNRPRDNREVRCPSSARTESGKYVFENVLNQDRIVARLPNWRHSGIARAKRDPILVAVISVADLSGDDDPRQPVASRKALRADEFVGERSRKASISAAAIPCSSA